MPKWLKQGLWIIVVIALLAVVVANPQAAADSVQGVVSWLGSAVSGLIAFFQALAA